MTDEEIIKALECCFITESCENCPMDKKRFIKRFIKCIDKIGKNALNLINRQHEEIEKLRERNTFGEWKINCDDYYPYRSECKNEPPGRIMTDYCPRCGAKMNNNDK